MEGLFIDLSKAGNRGHLVPKKVPVKGENGKVHYAIRWVNPNKDDGNTEGTNEILDTPDIQSLTEEYMKQDEPSEGILQEDIDPTEEFSEGEENKIEEEDEFFDDSTVFDEYLDVDDFFDFEDDEYWEESEQERDKDLSDFEKLERKAREVSDIGNGVDYMDYLEDFAKNKILADSDTSFDERLDEIDNIIGEHFPTVRKIAERDIMETEDTDQFIKNVQKTILKDKGYVRNQWTRMGTNPKMLKHALVNLLGDEKYGVMYKSLGGANLTINTRPESLRDQLDYGYSGQTIESALKRHTTRVHGEDKTDEYVGVLVDMLEDGKTTEDVLEFLYEVRHDDTIWGSLQSRLQAEWDAMKLEIEDRRPAYIAFNPSGDANGPTDLYGPAVLGISDELLSKCTTSMDDTFETTATIAKVHDLDHLKDLYMLKCCMFDSDRLQESSIEDLQGGEWTGWHSRMGAELPLEVQFHMPTISPDDMWLINEGEVAPKEDDDNYSSWLSGLLGGSEDTAPEPTPLDELSEELEYYGVDTVEADQFLNYLKSTLEAMDNSSNPADKLDLMKTALKDVGSDIMRKATEAIIDMGDVPDSTKNIQKNLMEHRLENPVKAGAFGTLGMSPGILSLTLKNVYGDKYYDVHNKILSKGSLTINTNPSTLDKIKSEGYSSRDLTEWVNQLPYEDGYFQSLHKEFMELGDTPGILERLKELSDTCESKHRPTFDSWHARVEGEWNTMRLEYGETKPCYISFNPDGNPEGGARPEIYGAGVLTVFEDALEHCTCSIDDSCFMNQSVPAVATMHHLTDLFMLKMCDTSDNNSFNKSIDNVLSGDSTWASKYKGDIMSEMPLELQYHGGKIPPKLMRITNKGE